MGVEWDPPGCAPHAASNNNVVSLDLASIIRHDYDAHIISEEVHAVVPGHGDGHLELARQEHAAVQRLRRALKVGPEAVEHPVLGHLGTL